MIMDFTKNMDLHWGHAIALVTGVLFLVVSVQRRRIHWPMAPGKLPLIGHAMALADPEQAYNVIMEWMAGVGQEEGIFEFNLFGQRWIVFGSTESVMALQKLRPFKIRRAKVMSDAIDSLKINGLLTSEGDQWRKERRIVGPALNQQHVRDFHPSIQVVARRLVQKWGNYMEKNKSVPAANDDITSSSLDIVALTILGMDINTLEHPETQVAEDMQELVRIIMVRILAPVPYWKIPVIGPHLDGFRKGNKRLLDTITSLVKEYRERKQKGETNDRDNNRQNFLEKIIDISEGEKAKFSDEEVVGNLLTIFAAGTDTTSNTISFSIWELANDLALQEELHQEVSEYIHIGKKSPDALTMEDCQECFPRLRSFLFEILRLKGPTPINYFEAVESMEFLGKTIVPGDVLAIIHASSPHDKNSKSEVPLGPDGESPQEFCARRWLSTVPSEEEKKDDASRTPPELIIPTNRESGIMPFGHGLRVCPGRMYAEVEMVTILVHLLHNFRFTPAKDCPPLKVVSRFTLTLDKEMKLALTPRNT